MALIDQGQIGDFKGKIGRVVVAPYRKKTVGRAAPKKSTKQPTLVQLDQRAQFGLVTAFVSGVREIINLGYQNLTGNSGSYNMATKWHLDNAVTGVYPNYAIDYSKVKLSDGKNVIDGIFEVAKTDAVNSKTTITWMAREAVRGSLPTDKLCAVFYNHTEKFFMMDMAASERSKLTATVRIPLEEDTDVIHGWVLFISTDGKQVSRSKYLGIIKNT